MVNSIDDQLSALLVEWHRWARAVPRIPDTRLGDFGEAMNRLPPQLRTALIIQARNLAAGCQVWASPRVQGNVTHEARQYLRNVLEKDGDRWFKAPVVELNAEGRRVGQTHHRAKHSDQDIALLRELRDAGCTIPWLAEKFEMAVSTVHGYCSGRVRDQTVARVRKV